MSVRISYKQTLIFAAVGVALGCGRGGSKSDVPAVNDPVLNSAFAALNERGARVVLDSMFQNEEVDSLYSARIQSGDSMWLEFARRLRPSSDAAMSEGLDTDLALAIPNAPSRVLRTLRDTAARFNVDWVCNLPLLESPDSVVQTLRSRSLAALATVKESELMEVRDKCAARISR